ncbi:MAG TPA: glucosidase, partial [Myxococcota bacterium]|nr:glucosidase [Myxococcota bacterium]
MSDARPRETPRSSEHARLAEAPSGGHGDWKAIGPYLAERAWGTVREDYSADGRAWEYFPYEHARSRAYRWSEDGLAGVCDLEQHLCLALAFWNGRDPFLKERIFGLGGSEGNHAEDAKEYWWYVDATPTSSWLRWRYHYPQAEFPYARLREENAKRGKQDREFELVDTGIFDGDRYWQIEADYAKAAPRDLCLRLRIRNAGPDPAELHVLPTLWFRNRWSWEDGTPRPTIRAARSRDAAAPASAIAEDERGRLQLAAGPDPAGRAPELLFCDNETNAVRLFGAATTAAYPKDGINDHVVGGAATVNPARQGTKLACWYRVSVAPGESVELRLRLARADSGAALDLGAGFERTLADRQREADEFYAQLRPAAASDD